MKDKATILLERVESVNQLSSVNEEDFDPTLNRKSNDSQDMDNQEEDGDEPTDENPEAEDEPTDDQSDDDSQLEQIEMKFMDSLTEAGLISCEAETQDNSVSVDLGFENDNFSIQMYIEDGIAKAVLMRAGQDEPVEEMELPTEFVDEDGNLVINVDMIPVDSISKAITDLIGNVGSEEPVQEFYRYRDGMVESFTKSVKLEKKVSMRYKKESKKKKAKRK